MNKNVFIAALIIVMLVIAGFLVYGIVTHTNAPKAQEVLEPAKASEKRPKD